MALTFTATQGANNPLPKSLSLRNTGGGTLTWSISDDRNWVTAHTPANTTTGTTTTETDSITVSIDTLNLQPNTYSASITITAPGASNPSEVIPVTLTVNQPTTSSATLRWDPNAEQDLAFYNIYRSTTPGTYGTAIATIPAGTVTHQLTNLPGNTTYYFTVTAVDTQGNESPYSNEVSKSIP